jgi:hypothetical protein
MKSSKYILITVAFLALASMCARPRDAKVIVNSSVSASSVSTNELRSNFLQEKNSLSDGTHVEPVTAKVRRGA